MATGTLSLCLHCILCMKCDIMVMFNYFSRYSSFRATLKNLPCDQVFAVEVAVGEFGVVFESDANLQYRLDPKQIFA